MLESYNTIKSGGARHEIVIEKSRFITECFRTELEKDALGAIEDMRKKYPAATHHCYAYNIGTETNFRRFNDDGEPSGTAGMPILNVITQNCLFNVTIIVIRYFGGVKLGAGGLTRAYSRAAAEAIKEAGIVRMQKSFEGSIEIDYHYLKNLENYLRKNEEAIKITDRQFDDRVKITLITKENWDRVSEEIVNLCAGKALCAKLSELFYEWPA